MTRLKWKLRTAYLSLVCLAIGHDEDYIIPDAIYLVRRRCSRCYKWID